MPEKVQADETVLVLCTCPDESSARTLALSLLENKLAACINIVPKILSLYYWEGKLNENQETLLLVKTLRQHYSELEHHLKTKHPYDCPEILCLSITQGLPEYLNWIKHSLSA